MASWVSVDEYIAQVEERQGGTPLMSREDAVLLSLMDTTGPPGRCWACGADIRHKASQARYCDLCGEIRHAVACLEAQRRYKEGVARRVRCVDCGQEYPARPGPTKRCRPCQAEYNRTQDVERMRRRRAAAKAARQAVAV